MGVFGRSDFPGGLLKNYTFGLLLSLLCSYSMWFYVDRVLVPYQINDAVAHARPRGNLSDLYPRWLGARELLLNGRDPYSRDVTRDIQIGYYGRALDPSKPDDPEDEQAFAYPAYVVLLLAPTVKLSFPLVQRITNVLFWLLTIASVWLWLKALNWKPSLRLLLIFVVLTMGSVPVVQGLKHQQLSLLVAGVLAAACATVVSGYLAIGGVLLAISTIKPQLAWLPVLWLLAWVVRDWRKRQRFAWAFGATMAVLLIGAEIILPGWLIRFIAALGDYHRYTHNESLLSWMFSPIIGNFLAVILVVASAMLCWKLLEQGGNSADFALCLSLVFALTIVVVPMLAPYNQVLLLPAVFLLARHGSGLWHGSSATRVAFGTTAMLLVWPWAATVGLMAASAICRHERYRADGNCHWLRACYCRFLCLEWSCCWPSAGVRRSPLLERVAPLRLGIHTVLAQGQYGHEPEWLSGVESLAVLALPNLPG